MTASPATSAPAPAEADDPGLLWPDGYEMTPRGFFHRTEWLSGPFQVLAMVRTAEGGSWSLALRFRDPDGREKTEMVSLADLASDGGDIRRTLSGRGLRLASKRRARELMMDGLNGVVVSRRALLVDRAGWHAGGAVFVAPHRNIKGSDEAEDIIFPPGRGNTNFLEQGTLAEWRAEVAPLAAGQSRLLFALGIALAGPLLDPLGFEGGVFHLMGQSSSGKTTALLLAGSVWGGGGPLGAAVSWRITANALEGTAAAHNDTFLGLDELGQCDPRELDAAAYALTGGSGKGRMKADGELRARARWRIVSLSTGEVTIAERIAEGAFGRRVRAGQMVRFIDIEADAGAGLGIFDHVAPTGDPAALAGLVANRAGRFFGTAGPAFVEALIRRRPECLPFARKIVADFVKDAVPPGASGQVYRVAQRFGLVAAAGELAVMLDVLPFAEGAVLAAADGLFRRWMTIRGGTGTTEAADALSAVREFIQRHGSSRFSILEDGTEKTRWHMQNKAGYRNGDGDYLLNDAAWKEAINGLNSRMVADTLFKAGYMQRNSDNGSKKKHKVDGIGMRFYHVNGSILGSDYNDKC